MGDTESIRVVVIHPSPLLRRGVRLALEDEPDLAVVGEFGRAEPAVAKVSQLDPRVVVLSVSMPDMSGFAACIQILDVVPETRVIMLTSQVARDELTATILVGAAGYLPMDGPEQDLIRTVRCNGNGEMLFIPAVAALVLETSRSNRRLVDVGGLNDRERQVLFLAASGMNNTDIGERLTLSPNTVRGHMSRIFRKLHISSRTELGIFAGKVESWRPENGADQ